MEQLQPIPLAEAPPYARSKCAHCGEEFVHNRMRRKNGTYSGYVVQQKYCSSACRIKANHEAQRNAVQTFQCEECGATVERHRREDGKGWTGPARFCNRSCSVKNTMRAVIGTGDGWLDKNGYKIVSVDGVDIPEHRYVMEKSIGRKLFPEETVHHMNGNRADNRPENLELWSSRHGKGQRVDDKLLWCLDFLADYPDELNRLGFRLVSDSIKLLRWPTNGNSKN